MRAIVVLGFVWFAPVFGLEPKAEPSIQYGYHDNIGIPLAKKIYEAEKAAFERQQDVDLSRIVGGVVSSHEAHPYLGGLLIYFPGATGVGWCSTSLLSWNRLITSAHCWNDGNRQAWQFTVVLGSQYLFFGLGTRINTTEVVMHPGWNPSTLQNDVAMIYLPVNVVFNQRIQPVALPTGNLLRQSLASWSARAAGYGRISDTIPANQGTQVNSVGLEVITVQDCQNAFGTTFVIDSTICTSGAGGVGVCSGDSGGPLVVTQNGRDVLVGVSSFVASAGCEAGFPSAYARVTSFTNWILQHMW
ncbi:trypsin domain-containing protein [Phthorimaea operculella]|nr:trypsin domain-containing protein [Phthorimaea operculella]